MGWSIGYDSNWSRDVGYGVPAYCGYPNCDVEIDRGLAYVCGGKPFGGEDGCGLYFCSKHLNFNQLCLRCYRYMQPFVLSQDHPLWIRHKLEDPSWAGWRDKNQEIVSNLQRLVRS